MMRPIDKWINACWLKYKGTNMSKDSLTEEQLVERAAEKLKKEAEVQKKLDEDMAKFKAFRDIGDRFTYLDVDMIVVWYGISYIGRRSVQLVAEYVSGDTEFKTATFNIDKLPILIKENNRKKK